MPIAFHEGQRYFTHTTKKIKVAEEYSVRKITGHGVEIVLTTKNYIFALNRAIFYAKMSREHSYEVAHGWKIMASAHPEAWWVGYEKELAEEKEQRAKRAAERRKYYTLHPWLPRGCQADPDEYMFDEEGNLA